MRQIDQSIKKDAELYQYEDYKVGERRTLYFPEVHGKQEKGIAPWEGWEPGKYISVCNNHIDKVKIARIQILAWHSLNKQCDILVAEVYGYDWRTKTNMFSKSE